MALKLDGRPVLVVGGDDEAVDKLPKLLDAGARITCVAPQASPVIANCARMRQVAWFARSLCESDLQGQAVVIATSRDPAEAARLRALKGRYGFLLCAIDLPEFCDFFMMSTVRRGPVQIGITTGGAAPLLARRVRQALEAGLDPGFADFGREFAELRESLRGEDKVTRKTRLEAALNGFAMEVALRYPEGMGASARAGRGTGRGL